MPSPEVNVRTRLSRGPATERLWVALIVPWLMWCIAIPAHAQSTVILPPMGGYGGSHFEARCPQSQHLAGFDLRGGDFLDAIRPICKTAYGPAETGPPIPGGIWFGGNGGSPHQILCPIDAPIVARMYIRASGGKTVSIDSIHLWCGMATPTQTLSELPNAVYNGREANVSKNIFGGGGGTTYKKVQDCPTGLVAVGISGRSGLYLDAVGLICGVPVLTAKIPEADPRPSVKLQGRVKLDTTHDFNGDGQGDILWHNSSTGEAQIWFMKDSSRIGRATVVDIDHAMSVKPPWRIVRSHDMNRDQQADLIRHNSATGEIQIWHLLGYKVSGRVTVLGENGTAAFVGAPWSIVGSGDFNGDGTTDLLWHNSATGEAQIWHMNAYKVIGRATVLGENGAAAFVGAPWSIVGSGDFNRDDRPDVLWYNSATGETQIWHMSGYRVISRATVNGPEGTPAMVRAPWRAVGAGDFNLDGNADILWHNDPTGETQIWHMSGYRVINRATITVLDGGANMVGAPWSIIAH